MRPIRMIVISGNTTTSSRITQVVAQTNSPVEIVGSFEDFQAAVQYLSNHVLEAILIDGTLLYPATLVQEIKALSLKRFAGAAIVILQQPTLSLVQQLIVLGVRGIIHKNDYLESHLVQVIILGQQRGLHVSPGISQCIDALRTLPIALSPRAYDVLKLLASGLEPKAIASHVGIGIHTVYRTLRSLRDKFDAQSNSHLTAVATQEKAG